MKKLLLLCISILPILSFSQELVIPGKRCGTYEVLQNFRKQNAGTESDQQFESWLNKKKSARLMTTLSAVTLPVVFHIIYNGETEGTGTNISQASIQQQILQLNKDFSNAANSPYTVSANTNIQFALAQTDPSGNLLAQPGIDRINRVTAGFTAPPYTVGYSSAANNYLTSTIKPATIWNPAKYINVWVLPMEGGVLGIATFPASSGLSGITGSETNQTAGISIVPTSVGSVFSPGSCTGYTKGKTLTHELGHFLGLRHIWGDAACGDDFCGDTPVHEGPNSGAPSHPKSNNCGTTDEMFENYMDYSNDVVLNTFTADQVSRMQTVLANSPRRNTLASSDVGLVTVTGTNRIAFADCGSLVVAETGIAGVYPRYRDLSFNLNVEDKATGNATVTIVPGGTAINNFHYQVLTPVLNFVAGDNYQSVGVRILDNAQVDGSRTLVLNFSVAGTGVQTGPSAQSITITITDDDNITISQNQVTLFSQNFDVSLTGWGVLASSGMPNIFRVSNGGNAGGTGNCAYISNTSAPYANSYTKTVPGVSVLRSPLIDASGISNLQLSFKYKVWGEVYESEAFDYGLVTYATQSSPASFLTTGATGAGPYADENAIISNNPTISLPNGTFSNNKFYLGFYWENDDNSGNDIPFNIDDIVLTGTGTNVENTISTSYGYDMQAGAGVNYFRSTNNKIIARLTNAGTAVSGIVASVMQTGTGQAGVITSNGSFMRTEKIIQLSPAIPNNSVSYQATFYYTAAELDIWGTDKLNLKILKINDGVSLTDPITSGNATLVTPTVVESLAGGYIAYTASFTGFSQFVLVSPTFTLPVRYVLFEAKPDKRSIVLTWKTSIENNNKGFAVERSSNGIDFVQIGWVTGKGTISSSAEYNFTDNYVQPGILYYYRLRQIDFDGHQHVSVIRQASINESQITVSVFPNPASDNIKLFVSGASALADIRLVNGKGQHVGYWPKVDCSSQPFTLNIGHFAKGSYTLLIRLKDKEITSKLFIQ